MLSNKICLITFYLVFKHRIFTYRVIDKTLFNSRILYLYFKAISRLLTISNLRILSNKSTVMCYIMLKSLLNLEKYDNKYANNFQKMKQFSILEVGLLINVYP